jgi:hypothetical protein
MTKRIKLSGFVKFIRFMDVLTWSILFAGLVVLGEGKPETQTVLDNRYDKVARGTWLTTNVTLAFWIMIIAIIVSILGLLINLGFLGNKKHHISYGMLSALFFSILCAGLIYFNLMI